MSATVLQPKRNAAPDLAARLLDGADLRLFLQPDETIASRQGDATSIEALDLPHLVIRDGRVWAAQRNQAAYVGGPGVVGRQYFAYYSGADIFSNNSYSEDPSVSKTVRSQLMSTGRYKRFDWASVDHGWEVVHDSAESDSTERFVAAIKACRRFKLRVDFEEGYSQIHPVVYPFYFPDDDAIQIESEIQFFPDYMRQGQSTFEATFAESLDSFRDSDDRVRREEGVLCDSHAFSSYYRIYKHARGKRIFDLGGEAVQRFARTLVFAAP